MRFRDREQAGILLAEAIRKEFDYSASIVVGIPRGGMIIAHSVSKTLQIPIGMIIVKKITHPSNRELAIGAVAQGNVVFWEQQILKDSKLSRKEKIKLSEFAKDLVKKREKVFGLLYITLDFHGKTIILVDDGVATGATVIAASMALGKMGAASVILAVPVTSSEIYRRLKKYFSKIIVLNIPEQFYAVGQFYEEFPEVSEEEITNLLASST
ncbi:MAG: phosphoribosyltransferase [Candidatus Levybacteria bacterium]|nr:phosphoribosyltransferase [Candidatus Levybacteria bacterium]